ncbi:WhiB family transcriptional regulator [Streptomyces sp. NPDC088736]|uniref:WhiB family transcriptional regulator n=1 Tax=Streptomyces sp. NPDC088736 TaxID=3365881 RepID=UPI0037FBA0BE
MTHYQGSVPDTRRAPDWRDNAECARPEYEGHRDLWFPSPGDHTALNLARTICSTCPVRRTCLTEALRNEGGRAHANRHGVLGGLSGRQRRALYERLRDSRAAKRAKAAA